MHRSHIIDKPTPLVSARQGAVDDRNGKQVRIMGQQCRAYRYNHVIVVEVDIDPSQDEQVEWASGHRVNAGEGGIVIFPGILVLPFFSDKAIAGPWATD